MEEFLEKLKSIRNSYVVIQGQYVVSIYQLDELIQEIETAQQQVKVEPEVKPANGGLDYDFIVRVMLSMTEYPDMLPENIRTEKAKLSKRYEELYDKKEPHILARIEWLKNYIESRLSV